MTVMTDQSMMVDGVKFPWLLRYEYVMNMLWLLCVEGQSDWKNINELNGEDEVLHDPGMKYYYDYHLLYFIRKSILA